MRPDCFVLFSNRSFCSQLVHLLIRVIIKIFQKNIRLFINSVYFTILQRETIHDDSSLERDRRLVKDIRDYLKKKKTTYI